MLKSYQAMIAFMSLSIILATACKKKEEQLKATKPGSAQATPAEQTNGSGTDNTNGSQEAPLFTLTDQSRYLEDILEKGTLSKDDCDAYFKGQTDRKTTLRCGKWMYFYDSLGVPGIPQKLADLMRNNAPQTVGKSFQNFGLYRDPYSKAELAVGMSEGPDMVGGVKTYTLTCGSCHFGKLPDGRYVVGSPNQEFAFGKLTLAAATLPELAFQKDKSLPPEVRKVLNPIVEEVFGKAFGRIGVIAQAIQLLPSVLIKGVAAPSEAAKLDLAILPAGVLDPYSPPSLDDKVKVPLRISPLWGIDQKGMEAAGSKHGAMLGSGGGAPDLKHIMRTFKVIAGEIRDEPIMKTYKEEEVTPLIEYILSLAPPKSEEKFEMDRLATGKSIFKTNCGVCHNGPGYAGTRVFQMAEVGTDPNVARMVDPENSGKAVFDVLTPEELTGGVRARRLSGIFSRTLLLHNGSVTSLNDLFCVNGPRIPSTLGSGYSNAGHDFTCKLAAEEKKAVMYFLQSL